MGSGKTSVGWRLARELGYNFLDTDKIIENTEKMAISEIFAKKSEAYFRTLETETIKSLQDYDGFVIATGGGIVLKPENVPLLKEIGPIILLWAEPDTVYERVKNDQQRPLLKVADPKKEIVKLLEFRAPFYREAADYIVDTNKKDIDKIAKEIMGIVKIKGVKDAKN